MPDPTITLTTDFGDGSPYVAAVKGVLLGRNPWVRVIDLTHAIPPQDLHHTAYFLASAIPYFPPGPIHVVVVDPGVGSERALLYVELDEHRLLVPDNGCWTTIQATTTKVRRLTEPSLWRHPVSPTFHGRDILAPVAAHLSLGLDPARLGPEVSEWVVLELPGPAFDPLRGELSGVVQFIDTYGNLIVNMSDEALLSLARLPPPRHVSGAWTFPQYDWPARLRVGVDGTSVPRFVRAYADAEPGDLVYLFSSENRLEIAVVQGNAARRLNARVGSFVVVSRSDGL